MKTYTIECHCTEGPIAATCFVHNALWLLGASANYIGAMANREGVDEACDSFCDATESFFLATNTGKCTEIDYIKKIDPN